MSTDKKYINQIEELLNRLGMAGTANSIESKQMPRNGNE